MFTFFDLHLTIFAIANYVIDIGVSEGSLKRGKSGCRRLRNNIIYSTLKLHNYDAI